MSPLLRNLGWVIAAAAVLLAFAVLFQRRLLYFPDRASELEALARAERLGLVPWRDGAGRLVGWRLPPPSSPRPRLLVLHGNAGSALDRIPWVAALARHRVDVVLLEYPGYGARPGTPSADALTEAAVAAIDALAAEGAPVWLLGESVGSGVAARATAARPEAVRGLLLVTPFADLAAVARRHYPMLPAFLIRDRYAPARDLARWRGPAVVLAAGADEVTTLAQAQALFDALQGPKKLVVQDRATHNGLDLSPRLPVWDEVVAFLGGESG